MKLRSIGPKTLEKIGILCSSLFFHGPQEEVKIVTKE